MESGERSNSWVALLDWDNTLHRGWTLTGWAEVLVGAGLFPRQSLELIRDLITSYLASHVDHDALAATANQAYAEGLNGQEQHMVSVAAERFAAERNGKQVFAFVRSMLAALGDLGVDPIVVSGAPEEVLAPHCRSLGIRRWFGLRLEVDGVRYTGRIASNPGVSGEKAHIISSIKSLGHVAFAAGDSASDTPLFEAASVSLLVVKKGSPIPSGISMMIHPESAEHSGFLAELRTQLGSVVR